MYVLDATCPHEIRERFVSPVYILIYIYNPTVGGPLALLRGLCSFIPHARTTNQRRHSCNIRPLNRN